MLYFSERLLYRSSVSKDKTSLHMALYELGVYNDAAVSTENLILLLWRTWCKRPSPLLSSGMLDVGSFLSVLLGTVKDFPFP